MKGPWKHSFFGKPCWCPWYSVPPIVGKPHSVGEKTHRTLDVSNMCSTWKPPWNPPPLPIAHKGKTIGHLWQHDRTPMEGMVPLWNLDRDNSPHSYFHQETFPSSLHPRFHPLPHNEHGIGDWLCPSNHRHPPSKTFHRWNRSFEVEVHKDSLVSWGRRRGPLQRPCQG